MPMYNGFSHEEVVIISKALNLVEDRINLYVGEKKKSVNSTHHDLVEKERLQQINYLDFMREILKQADNYNVFTMDGQANSTFMKAVRSALEVYLQDLLLARASTGFSSFDSAINQVRQIISIESLKNLPNDVFVKYYAPPSNTSEEKPEIFISYSTLDKEFAGKVAGCLREEHFEIFLAHEDIEVSEEWRKQILVRLKRDNVLIAILTPSYEKSVWGNQEAGFMMGKGGRIIPIIVDGTDIRNFGFLETFQGIPTSNDNLPICVEKIVNSLS